MADPAASGTVGLVDVVTVAYGNVDEIAENVRDLLHRPEVASMTVVDHGADGSGAAARDAGAVVFADPSNPGFGAGINRAARHGSAPFVLLMNPDARLDPDALGVGLATLAEHGTAAAVQGLIETRSSGGLERAGGREPGPIDLLGRATAAKALLRFGPVRRLVGRVSAVSHQVQRATSEPRDVQMLVATAPLVRREAFESVDGFDERYFLYGEDLDLCRRLRRREWELLYLPVPWAEHENGSCSAGWWNRELRWWEGTMAFAARWWDTRAFLVGQLAAGVMCCRLVVRQPRRAAEAWRALVASPLRIRRTEGQGRLVR